MGGVWQSLIAVLGTLAGGGLASFAQARVARIARRETRRDARRSEALEALAALATAVADHRRAMWLLEDARLSGMADEVVRAARDESHTTRSAITAPLFRIGVLVPQLAEAAQAAVEATFAMRDASSQAVLQDLRAAARDAETHLTTAACALFADTSSAQ